MIVNGMVEQWNWSEAELDEVNDGKQEVRFLLISSSFPLFQFSIDPYKLNRLISKLIHCFLHQTHVNL